MTFQNGESTSAQDPTLVTGQAGATNEAKGKGKAAAPTGEDHEDTSMAEDDDEEDTEADEETEAADEDGMEEIDLDNVIGRRTRGKVIDFAKAAEENPVEEEDDEDEDEDFEVEDEKMED
ncbi:histone chaperone domain CHZ-domain-containing protein [Lasiosphaeria hispida]|uniref:Histone chaperone domain CHZ-domain-containing protein n=1 Tax=Lasiosphaeria hispida TaxID=260671 RepID=A0AAJ0H8H3_9PEZI|nr:histone chaperone domain CHZ-domain-containing protein [Lasiosphaeria hispida]